MDHIYSLSDLISSRCPTQRKTSSGSSTQDRLFAIAVGIQLLVTSLIIQTELVTQNTANGLVNLGVSAIVLLVIPVVLNRL